MDCFFDGNYNGRSSLLSHPPQMPRFLSRFRSVKPAHFRQRLVFEPLEDRELLAAVLVDDINTHPRDSLPDNLVAVGQNLFFTAKANDQYGTPMLWKTDGTAAGTVKVKDVRTSNGQVADIRQTVAIGNTLYFADYLNGIWKSDGTDAGTTVVKSMIVNQLTPVGSTLFFAGSDSAGMELWKSDGTTAGTVMVKDIRSGSAGSGPWYLTAVGSQLYFVADDGVSGKELWKSDGTAAGTVRVTDINPGAGSAEPQSLTVVGSNVYFIATDGSNYRLYKTDGVTTSAVSNIQFPASQSSTNRTLVAAGSTLFFNQNKSELWKTDGTTAGTVRVATIPNTQAYITFTDFEAVGSTLYFIALDDAHGYELWRSDGTAAGTYLVKDAYPGTEPGLFDSPLELTRVGTSLYFISNDADLWKSDGTAAGTVKLKTFEILSNSDARPRQLTAVGNQLFFTADDATAGYELWRTDGTASGTRITKDLRTGTVGSAATPIGVGNGYLYLNADEVVREIFTNGRLPTLWKTTGTAATTQQVFEQPIVSFVNDGFWGLGNIGANFYFAAVIGGGVGHVYVTNGTTVTDLGPGVDPRSWAVVGSRLFVGGDELWVTDGTVSGSHQVKDIWPDMYPSSPNNLAALGNTAIFAANDGTNGYELWKSDGTAAGTVFVKDINPNGHSNIQSLTVVNNIAYFSAYDGVSTALWRSDGTAQGTFKLRDVAPTHLFGMGSTLYFAGEDAANGIELWKSDGTVAGTVLVKDIFRWFDSNPDNFFAWNSSVYFTAQSTYQGPLSLWKTDGTDAGTVMVVPGQWGNTPHDFHVIGNTAYFVANDGATGLEVWQTDGTTAGTKLADDINPGANGSDPAHLTVLKNAVYFTADNGINGRELWKVVGQGVGAQATDIIDVAPDPRNSAVASVDVTFSDTINLSSFTFADITLTRNGTTVPLTSAVTTSLVSGTTYRINGLSSFTAAAGTYVITVQGSGITNVDGVSGSGAPSDTWDVDTTAPAVPVISAISTDAGASATDHLTNDQTLVFTGTAEANTTVRLTRAGSGVIGTAVATASGTWTIDYSSTTLAAGTYTFTATATDAVGNTSAASATFSVTIDTSAPAVTDVVDVSPDPRSIPVSTIDIVFSEAISAATLNFADLTLTRNGSPIALSSLVAISFVSGNTYRISGLDNFTSSGGSYVLTVNAAGITDIAGNAGVGSASDAWSMQTAPQAGGDQYVTDEDTLLSVTAPGVLANDFDADPGDTIRVSRFDAVSSRGLPISGGSDGHFSYDPRGYQLFQDLAAGESLSDTFTYTLSDSQGHSVVGFVQLTITGNNDYYHALHPMDVDGDNRVLPIDALYIINYLNTVGVTHLSGISGNPTKWLDPSNDGYVTPLDALLVINDLNAAAAAEGERTPGLIASAPGDALSPTVLNLALLQYLSEMDSSDGAPKNGGLNSRR
jgi:ELWxxDGT repeat protein/VCBS repeat-containing protein